MFFIKIYLKYFFFIDGKIGAKSSTYYRLRHKIQDTCHQKAIFLSLAKLLWNYPLFPLMIIITITVWNCGETCTSSFEWWYRARERETATERAKKGGSMLACFSEFSLLFANPSYNFSTILFSAAVLFFNKNPINKYKKKLYISIYPSMYLFTTSYCLERKAQGRIKTSHVMHHHRTILNLFFNWEKIRASWKRN